MTSELSSPTSSTGANSCPPPGQGDPANLWALDTESYFMNRRILRLEERVRRLEKQIRTHGSESRPKPQQFLSRELQTRVSRPKSRNPLWTRKRKRSLWKLTQQTYRSQCPSVIIRCTPEGRPDRDEVGSFITISDSVDGKGTKFIASQGLAGTQEEEDH
ncbi:hypothetical protein FOXG_20915 [Fusarium oxysporum f. sp. lycopersici 4287]|uniref:Uncharacterized protein n=1 Tax=Fusarium oxysporum f. sp. lycopersici (strain 4287 / CBS 123668 / FGSC 9935 / NRRL 34936) TaxID=426428 RepID=A0A0J9VSZ4_FUSO4|nr:hypothetical protein FOXG_20915 [Fusarium oxysporum f. sp. lycopersici 4287]EWZ78179.1 hypothetical protein FOWG_17509 [Fusarium oxysporum f. sp. lycopersici MN25]KNB13770.1 hypothetical protein FOXG_20915 [Fusarium oxysporum f. sp. lycopersici 4287]